MAVKLGAPYSKVNRGSYSGDDYASDIGSTLKDRLEQAMKGPPMVRAVDLARACAVKPPSVADWLSGRTKRLEGANLLNASRRLGVNPDWLATGRGPMRLNPSASRAAAESVTHSESPSQLLTPDPDILHEALTLLVYDQLHAGEYPPRAQAARLAELYGRVAADGGRLTKPHNDLFVNEVQARAAQKGLSGGGLSATTAEQRGAAKHPGGRRSNARR